MSLIQGIITKASHLGMNETDPAEIRLQKTILVGVSFAVSVAVLLWAGMYLFFQEPLAALTALAYILITLPGLYYFRTTRKYDLFLRSQMLAGLLLPFLQSLSLGGFLNSGAVILWSIITPIGELILGRPRSAYRWWAAYLGLVVFNGILQPYLRPTNHLPHWLISGLFVLNISGVSSIAIIALIYFVNMKDQILDLLKIEQEKAENLLLNILPREIAAILKNEQRTIADQYTGASVLFADLVGFTPLTAQMAPVDMVNLLNDIFSHFDTLVEKYDLEKIRTIGDSYMVASGVPRPRQDHARAIACLALDMVAYLRSRPLDHGQKIDFRIGINSGPVVGGVIGRKKFVFDIWGDAVNIASRMESHGLPGMIQITRTTYDLICDEFACEPRGMVSIKGRGEMETWFLTGKR